MSPAPPQSPAESRVPELDGLRGIAIALVLWCHLVNPFLPLGFGHPLAWLRAIGDMAWCGVDLFFVLSGYFIGGILLDRRDSPRLARVFYARRALRILPLYYATLAVCAAGVALGWIHAEYPAWTYLLFLTNFALAAGSIWDAPMLSPLWSIAVEEQFYLTAPWVVRWIPARRVPLLLGGLIVAAIGLRIGVHLLWPGHWMAEHMLMPLRMDLLATGALIAWAVRSGQSAALFARLRQTWVLWLATAFALLFGLAANRPPLGSPQLIWFGYALITACFGLVVLLVAGARPPVLCRALAAAPLVHLGRHSYFVYLGHMLIGLPLINWLGGETLLVSTPRGLLIVTAGIGATWAAAIVSWRWFESPLIALGHRLRY
ncbi:MAG: acyltransferase [Lacunisphaera sp.]|nr:acyltransferase [Lacunisphaera sp.]